MYTIQILTPSCFHRYPELSVKIYQLMDDYIQALRSKDETPGSLLAMTADAEQAILDKYKSEVVNKQAERERQRLQEKERKEQRKKEKSELKEEKKRVEEALGKKISNFDDEDMEDETVPEEEKILVSTGSSYSMNTRLTIVVLVHRFANSIKYSARVEQQCHNFNVRS